MTLPTEVWMNCIGALYDRTAAMRSYQSQGQKDLKNVSLVANAFRAFAQPHIFFRLSLGMPEGDLLDRIEGLQSLYDCRPESAGWTKYLRYRGTFRALSTDDHGEAIVGAMSSLFVRLHNLRNISIVSFDLTIEMLRHVYALRGPLTLGLYAVPDPKEGDESLDVEILNVGDLDIGGPTEGSVELIPQLALCPRLHTLRLREPAASRVFDYANSRTFTSIQHLHLPNPQSKTLSSFLSFLSACPNATSLYLGEGEIVGAAGRPDCILPPSTLPCLSSFYGVISDARRFIPGRPIHTVEAWVADGQEQALSEDVLSPLTKGSVQLRRLYLKFIPWTDGVLKNLVKLFPNIEELDISAWKEISADEMLGATAYIMKSFKKLERLDISHAGDLALGDDSAEQEMLHKQRRTLEETTLQGSSIHTVAFQKNFVWHRTMDKAWTCEKEA